MKRFHGRQAFTLSELLIAIAILGLLIALLLPAIGASRAAARRASCAVKLKNLATALHIYHDNFQKFPPSAFYNDGQNMGDKGYDLKKVVVGENSKESTRAPYSFLVKMLPYVEQGYIYDQIDFKNNEAFAPAHYALAAKIIPVYTCPDIRGNTASTAVDYQPPGGPKPALASYKALGATTLACLQDSPSVTNAELNGGTLHPYATYSFNTLKAPTQTAILVETKEPKYAAWWDGTTASIPGFHPGKGNVADDRTPTPPAGAPALNIQASGAQQSFITKDQFGGKEDMQWGPSSEHPGLVNLANGGTETRSIANNVDPTVYRALISRRANDNGDIGDFFR
ncbi:MAG: DUF1559 domain-containing protein [Planctomycetes bacterium]|nr:DUF1559 domain-containing protein [Planctomycetota bacterium]